MRLDFTGKTRAKITNVNVQAEKIGQRDLRPAVTLRIKVTTANTVLNKLSPTLRAFLFEKNGNAAKAQQLIEGVEPVSDLPQLTEAAKWLGALDWEDSQSGCKLVVYQGVSGAGDIRLKDVTVDKLKLEPMEGGGVDVSFNAYAADLDAETMGELAVLHQHEVDFELTLPEVQQQPLQIEGKKAGPATPEEALALAEAK